MAEYTLKITMDPAQLHFSQIGYKICVASGVETNGVMDYNVVAYTTDCAEEVEIHFKDEYSVAATRDGVSHHKHVEANSNLHPIQFGQAFTLPSNWTNEDPRPHRDAPSDGFLFNNKAARGSCLLYKKIEDELRAIYVSPLGPLAPGKEAFVPKPIATVWLQGHTETGDMIEYWDGQTIEVDFSEAKHRTAHFNKNGKWVVVDA